MTPGFQVTISRPEGQWRNLFRRIRRIPRSAAILDHSLAVSLDDFFRPLSLGDSQHPNSDDQFDRENSGASPRDNGRKKPSTYRGTMQLAQNLGLGPLFLIRVTR
jgi:hypothetical protein